MSFDQQKQIDNISMWAMRGIVGLCCFSCSIIFYNVSGDIGIIKVDVGEMKIKMMRVETQFEDSKAENLRRDEAIRDIQRALNNRK